MKLIKKVVLILIYIFSTVAYTQPELQIAPDDLRFENMFSRLENAFFINEGNEPLKMDSIVYNNNLYYVRFDNQYLMPFYIEPGDTVKMDCILAGYYYIPSSDTSDTMFVYSNSANGDERINIKIAYWDDDYKSGTINGYITDTLSSPVPNANVHFFYAGNYIIHSTTTDQEGFYNSELPPGSYIVAAEKDSFYATFFGQQFDPLNAEFISLENDSIRRADIILLKEFTTSNSVTGIVYDSLSGTPLRKAVVVVRNGTHSPTKIAEKSNRLTNNIYTVFVSDSGYYRLNNIINPGYYYIQSFSDYFVPSYYSLTNTSQIFWQNADSVFIGSDLNNLHIYMPRDSSLGGGNALGSVALSTGNAGNISDIIIYAQDVNTHTSIFNYAFTSNEGNFRIPFLPYGEYRLVGQKIGFNDGFSSVFTIDSMNTIVSGLKITLVPTSVYENPFIPENPLLLYNYPNPFNPITKIEFTLPYSSEIELTVFNLLGEQVKALLKENLSIGKYSIELNAAGLTSGTYFVVLKTKREIRAAKILLLK